MFRHQNLQNLLKTDLSVSDNVWMLNFMPKEYKFLEFAKQTKNECSLEMKYNIGIDIFAGRQVCLS
jgi:hypothetical protein